MAANAPFDGVGFVFQTVDFLVTLLEGNALIGEVALEGILKSPHARFDFCGMLLKTLKGGRLEHGQKWQSHDPPPV